MENSGYLNESGYIDMDAFDKLKKSTNDLLTRPEYIKYKASKDPSGVTFYVDFRHFTLRVKNSSLNKKNFSYRFKAVIDYLAKKNKIGPIYNILMCNYNDDFINDTTTIIIKSIKE